MRRRLRDGDHLGVGRGVAKKFSLIVRLADDVALVRDNGSDRNLVGVERLLSLAKRDPHEFLVHRSFIFQSRGHASSLDVETR